MYSIRAIKGWIKSDLGGALQRVSVLGQGIELDSAQMATDVATKSGRCRGMTRTGFGGKGRLLPAYTERGDAVTQTCPYRLCQCGVDASRRQAGLSSKVIRNWAGQIGR